MVYYAAKKETHIKCLNANRIDLHFIIEMAFTDDIILKVDALHALVLLFTFTRSHKAHVYVLQDIR